MALENGITCFRGYALEGNLQIREVLEGMASIAYDSPGMIRVEVDLPARADQLKGSLLGEVLRIVARGDGPLLLQRDRFAGETGR